MSSPLESQPSSTLLLREILAYAGATGPDLLDEALAEALSEVSVARCRAYVLVDLARPVNDPPVAGALVEVGQPARDARLRALVVALPHRGRGLGRRLLGDLLTEMRADGVQQVRYRVAAADPGTFSLLGSSGFVAADRTPIAACRYDGPAIEALAVAWLVREL
ncbi:GNAT family N-acetyltransferase [Streptosporangium sp. NPDC001681]|uniref:GNAT family N-acetyltransferase n=1 Tax=Streptosporangium sp. NPDC001681 TaxID=3154395 RepID=UPI00331D9CC4